jgi:lipopolysaccharide export system protein LptA
MSRIKNNIILLLLLLPIASLALDSDQYKPADLTADKAFYNRTTHISTYRGHINFSQGTTHLQANELVIYDGKNNKIYKIVAFGNQAHYSTIPNKKQKVLNAKADIIKYYPQKNTAILVGHAEVTQKGNRMRGPSITYNNKQQTILLNPSSKNQAHITFQP